MIGRYFAFLRFKDIHKAYLNQPIRLPGLKPALIHFANEDCKARGMLRVDTERRFLPRLKNRGLAPSNVSNKEELRVKGRAFGSPLARDLYPRASTAEVDPRVKPGAPAAAGIA